MKNIFKILFLVILFSGPVVGENVNIFDFTEQELSELDVRKVRGADNNTG